MESNDAFSIAARFVDLLVDNPALREETVRSFDGAEAYAVFARIVTGALALDPPLALSDVGPVEDAMAEIYERLHRREELKGNIRSGHRRYSTARG